MCVNNPVPFHSDTPVVAYKVMCCNGDYVQSLLAGNEYKLGCTYQATIPIFEKAVEYCDEYDVGFHAYETLEDAQRRSHTLFQVVEVELSDLTHKGVERLKVYGVNVSIYVAKQCKFVKIVEQR